MLVFGNLMLPAMGFFLEILRVYVDCEFVFSCFFSFANDIVKCRKICGKQHFLLGQRFGINYGTCFFFNRSLIVVLLMHSHVFLCQWDQLDTVYQFNWNFSNLEVSSNNIICQSLISVGFSTYIGCIRVKFTGDITFVIIVRMHLKRGESCMVRRFIYLVVQSVSS